MKEKTCTSSPSSRPRSSSRSSRGDIRLVCPAGLPGVTLTKASASPASQARHAHDSLVLGLVTAGTRRIDIAGTQTLVPHGAVFALTPGQAHACAPLGADGCSYLALSIIAQALPPELTALRLAKPRLDDPELAGLLGRLAEALNSACGLLEQQSLLAECLERLAGHRLPGGGPSEEGTNTAPTSMADAVHAARQRLEKSPEEGVDLASLAAGCAVSMFALHRAFTRVVGLPPHAFQTHLRLRRAKELLRGGASLADAALASGFCDQAHMTRHFARAVGLTPAEYAKAHRFRA